MMDVIINFVHFAIAYPMAFVLFVTLELHPSFNFMTTHPILSYPINSGLKEFQIFHHNGKLYYVINIYYRQLKLFFLRFMAIRTE